MATAQPAPASHHHRLLWFTVVGGFLDGLKREFGPRLNAIIGGRGTGKTTVLEQIRYTLDFITEDAEAPEARPSPGG